MLYGIKTVLRSPLKTILFFILISVVSAFLSLGAGMWQSAETMLDEADSVYMTVGEYVYTLGNYPYDAHYDEELTAAHEAFDINDYALDEALWLESGVTQRAYIQGYMPYVRDMPYTDYTVLLIKTGDLAEDGSYLNGRIQLTYYATNQFLFGRKLNIVPYAQDGTELLPNRMYVMFGLLTEMPASQLMSFEARSFQEDLNIPAEESAYSPVIDLTESGHETFWETEAGNYYAKVIESLRILNESVDMVVSQDMRAVTAFHQEEYTLVEGAFPESGDACVIPERIAMQMNLAVGDRFTVSVHNPPGETSRYNTYWLDTGYAADTVFEVAGIYRAQEVTTPIFIKNTGQEWIYANGSDYLLARVVLDNRSAAAYEHAVKPVLSPGLSLDIHDQGYETAARGIISMRETARLITGVCAAAGLAALWFFAYLFVYRAADNVRVLLRLGASGTKTMLFLLTGSVTVAAAAAAVGCACGFAVSRRVIDFVYSAAKDNSALDARFSIVSRGVQLESVLPSPEITGGVYAGIAVAIAVTALFLCFLFGLRVIRNQNAQNRLRQTVRRSQRQVHRVPVVNHSLAAAGDLNRYDHIPGTPLRYIAKSVFRGGWRSLTMPLLYASLLLFMFLFTALRDDYLAKRDSVYEDVPVTMWFTGIQYSQKDDLMIKRSQAEEVIATGYVSDAWFARNFQYTYLGVSAYADGRLVENTVQDYEIPLGEFSYNRFVDQLRLYTSPLISTNDYTKMREFTRIDDSKVTWADEKGWQSEDIPGTQTCLVSRQFLTANALSLNDIIAVSVFNKNETGRYENSTQHYRIGGVYISDINRQAIFVREDLGMGVEDNSVYNAFGFKLTNTQKLSGFKDWLSKHYDPIGKAVKNRRWVIVDDKMLYQTIDSLNRQIVYMNLLHPVMLGTVAVIGFIASSLLMKSRSGEINVLRSLGAGKGMVLCSFFLEPVFLSIPGMAVGAGLATLFVYSLSSGLAWMNVPLLAVCFYTGVAAAVFTTYRKSVMKGLFAET